MKNLFLSLFVAIIPILTVCGQDDTDATNEIFDFEEEESAIGAYKFHAGLRGGGQWTNIKSSPEREGSEREENYLGYLGQVIVGYRINNLLSVLLQSGISQTGVNNVMEEGSLISSSSSILSDVGLVDYRLKYWETNVLAAIHIAAGENFAPYIFIGPSYSYMLDANAEENKDLTLASTGTTFSVTNTRDASNDFKEYDWGLYLGVGVEIPMSIIDRTALYLEAGYRKGFTDIGNSTITTDNSDTKWTNSAWNLSVGAAYKIF